MLDLIRETVNLKLIGFGFVTGLIAFILWTLNEHICTIRGDYQARCKALEEDLEDVKAQMILIGKFYIDKRKESMAAAIKDATDNPEKYNYGTFAPVMSQGGELKDV